MKHGYIGTRLREARISKGVSVEQLASDLGTTVDRVLIIEAGATLGHSSTIIEMAKVVDITLADLFGPAEASNIIPFPKSERDK